MTQTLQGESSALVLEIHALLRSIDPARWRRGMEESARARFEAIYAGVQRILNGFERPTEARALGLYKAWQSMAVLLESCRPAVGAGAGEWHRLRLKAQPVYGWIAANLAHFSVVAPSLRPTNYRRNAFHVLSGVFCFVLVQHVLGPGALKVGAVAFAVWCWGMELLRVRYPVVTRFYMKVFAPIAHPHEHYRINSATWYGSALLVLSFTSPLMASLGVLVLAFGDPAAGVVGRRFGRTYLRSSRTLEGFIAFVLAGGAVSFGMMQLYYPELGLGAAALTAVVAALCGACAELFSGPVDDNLTIPLGSALGAGVALSLLGMS